MEGAFLELGKHFSLKELMGINCISYEDEDYILTMGEKKIIYILEGEARAIRYEDGKEIIYPHLLSKGDFIGSQDDEIIDNLDWEVKASSKVKALLFREKDADKYIYNNKNMMQHYFKKIIQSVESGLKGFYIQTRGGAKAHFAYLLVVNAKECSITYSNYLFFSKVLGISESMLYRITRDLIKKGYIIKEASKIIIKDREGLKEFYEEYMYG